MTEVQHHGFTFEKWVRDTFFEGYVGNYMQKWDIPANSKCSNLLPELWRGQAVSIKTAKYGSPIGLGDVLRQRQIDEPFLMIVGFWSQRTATEKYIVEIGIVFFPTTAWAASWGALTLDQLREIDVSIKDLARHHTEVRQAARSWKTATAALKTAAFVVNPKIDSKTQRRIQCSLPFAAFWTAAGRPPQPQEIPSGHPSQKPLDLIAKLVTCATDPGDLVLDPFLGSGSTAVAAQASGRAWLGIELNPLYAKLAATRVASLSSELVGSQLEARLSA